MWALFLYPLYAEAEPAPKHKPLPKQMPLRKEPLVSFAVNTKRLGKVKPIFHVRNIYRRKINRRTQIYMPSYLKSNTKNAHNMHKIHAPLRLRKKHMAYRKKNKPYILK